MFFGRAVACMLLVSCVVYKYYLLVSVRSSASLRLCCTCKGASTPLKKRRFTADAMSSGCSAPLLEDGMVDKRTTWPANDDQFESRRRLLANRNLFEVRFICSDMICNNV